MPCSDTVKKKSYESQERKRLVLCTADRICGVCNSNRNLNHDIVMSPEEKAEEIIEKCDIKHYMKLGMRLKEGSKGLPVSMYRDQVIGCALVVAETHLKELSKMKLIFSDRELHVKFWEQVREAIKKYEKS